MSACLPPDTGAARKTCCLDLTGDFACFTRPEMKVERVSYDAMTPSAARACLEVILWEPAIAKLAGPQACSPLSPGPSPACGGGENPIHR